MGAPRTPYARNRSRSSSRRQFTITVPAEIGEFLEKRSAATGMNKSAVVSDALEAERERQEDELMREGYEEMAAQDRELLQEFGHVDRDSNSSWPDY